MRVIMSVIMNVFISVIMNVIMSVWPMKLFSVHSHILNTQVGRDITN